MAATSHFEVFFNIFLLSMAAMNGLSLGIFVCYKRANQRALLCLGNLLQFILNFMVVLPYLTKDSAFYDQFFIRTVFDCKLIYMIENSFKSMTTWILALIGIERVLFTSPKLSPLNRKIFRCIMLAFFTIKSVATNAWFVSNFSTVGKRAINASFPFNLEINCWFGDLEVKTQLPYHPIFFADRYGLPFMVIITTSAFLGVEIFTSVSQLSVERNKNRTCVKSFRELNEMRLLRHQIGTCVYILSLNVVYAVCNFPHVILYTFVEPRTEVGLFICTALYQVQFLADFWIYFHFNDDFYIIKMVIRTYHECFNCMMDKVCIPYMNASAIA